MPAGVRCGNSSRIWLIGQLMRSYHPTTSLTRMPVPLIRGFGPPAPWTISMCSVLTSILDHPAQTLYRIIPATGTARTVHLAGRPVEHHREYPHHDPVTPAVFAREQPG